MSDGELGLSGVDPELASVLRCVASIVQETSRILRSANDKESGKHNQFGDSQLKVDVEVDEMVFERLRSCSAVEAASSEEQPDIKQLPGKGYLVAFDPLDGSSIIGANFAVGSIFGIWPGGTVVGSTGRQQVAAAYAVYGPQTLLVWCRPRQGVSAPTTVEEYVLGPGEQWQLRRTNITIAPTKNIFAPANLRAASGNKVYTDLVSSWIARNFTLRYTGGMVPDVHHMLAKGGGIFCNPGSAAAPAKLRLVFECAPLSFIMEAAGGTSHDGRGSVLDQVIESTTTRSLISLGSRELVEESIPAMQASKEVQAATDAADMAQAMT